MLILFIDVNTSSSSTPSYAFILTLMCASMAWSKATSRSPTSVTARPPRPARAVRPTLHGGQVAGQRNRAADLKRGPAGASHDGGSRSRLRSRPRPRPRSRSRSPVNVVLNGLGDVKVDDILHRGNVQAAAGHICMVDIARA